MGSLFRSEEMALCQLFLQSESAYACVSELGELGVVQFRDLNPDVNAFQRKFVNEVRRCDEMERKLRYLEKEIKRDEIEMQEVRDNPEAPAPREMIDLEATFEKMDNELKEVNANSETLKRNYLELTELKHILRKAQVFFDEQEQGAVDLTTGGAQNALVYQDALQPAAQAISPQLGFIAAVILRERLPAFERMLWRACKGNAFLKISEIETPLEDPKTGDLVMKTVVVVFFQGDQLKMRVKKICEGFHATLYPCPDTPPERREMATGVMTRIEDLNTVLSQTNDHRRRVLVNAAKHIKTWFVKVRKIKAIYHTLNLFNLDVTQKCLIAECWCPVPDLETIQFALRRGTERSGSTLRPILNRMETTLQPPTFNRTNKFTIGFQNLVDAYGVADYREVNPALYTIITFPFLFAVMFGDAGHGLVMFLFALWMVLNEKWLTNQKSGGEMWQMAFGGRYIILLMGAFSVYTGLIYNDIFSKSFNIFGSSWYPGETSQKEIDEGKPRPLNPNATSVYYGTPYPFGVDPVWQIASNKLSFLNSYKMKLSIIFGVTHMLFGVILSLSNHRYFKKPMNIFCEFIPQVIFLNSIFGYLVVLVFWKWCYYDANSSGSAPSLLINLINMFLFKYTPEAEQLNQRPFYDAQQSVQYTLVVIAVICVPWMLFLKPYLLYRAHQRKLLYVHLEGNQNNGYAHDEVNHNPEQNNVETEGGVQSVDPVAQTSSTVVNVESQAAEEKPFDFGEIFVPQCIHTIEYCLGCISNTASYLRLWALSLAHAQLSEVLWNMVLRSGLSSKNYIGAPMLWAVFAVWAFLSVAVLIVMEGLSAFLHALRLHWVEFQNKFYGGSGYLFTPFSFEIILEATMADGE